MLQMNLEIIFKTVHERNEKFQALKLFLSSEIFKIAILRNCWTPEFKSAVDIIRFPKIQYS